MANVYPPGPREVPIDITAPSPAYVRNARIAVLGLVLFVLAYLALLTWFSWTAYRLLSAWRTNGDDLGLLAWGIANVFFAIFLGKALLFFRRSRPPKAIELQPLEEPALFQFIHRLVNEAGAPQPHRVFLSHDVNAAVFYDLSFVNLLIPTRKNLLIGVGLINTLTLGEFKAVLAHEFGHFAQRSMAIGRWVYIGQQIAHHIVAKRDALDRVLLFISSIDIRIAWIGWLMRLIVWSLRSVLEIFFRLVVIAERALSREMEFQADLVAVALTGSDALIHALHRLGPADEALGEALSTATTELAQGRVVPDLYALQTRAIERMRTILADESYGASPIVPAEHPEQHRVFESPTAQPPKMWATHPPSRDREDNAKRRYIRCRVDDRPAWELFANPAKTRRRVTHHLIAQMGAELGQLETLSEADSIAALERRFDRRYFDPRYRGAYLGRSCVREAAMVRDLFERDPVAVDFSALYPESLGSELARWKDTMSEKATLEGLRDGFLKPVDGVIRYRGQALEPKQISGALAQIDDDCQRAREQLAAHDRRCRTMHWATASHFGADWAAYHYNLVALLHYADHSEANLRDAQAHLATLIRIVMADDRVTDAERARVVRSAADLHHSLWLLHQQARQVMLPAAIEQALEVLSWAELLSPAYSLPVPTEQNIGDWLNVIDGWLQGSLRPLDLLERQTLQHLLDTEALIESCIAEGRHPGPAPSPAQVPAEYQVLPPGKERELETKLSLWDRFYTAEGVVPATARTLVAAAIVAVVVYGGFYGW